MSSPSKSDSLFPGRDSLEATQGADSRQFGSWSSSQSSAGRQQQVGPYTVLRELGRGAWGVVFLAHKPGETPVAVKLLLDRGQADDEARARFEREAKLAARVRHPGIVPLFEAGLDSRGLYYAMEYVPGSTLKDYFLQRGRLLQHEACELVANLADALEEAHRQGVVHRDVKPANVILEAKTGRPRLTDFGLARDTWQQSNLTRTRDVIGTPAYMAPEQFSGAKVDARADVYALGVILYQALTGKLPFMADNLIALQQQVLRGTYPPLRTLRPDLPQGLESILTRVLARDLDQRLQSADQLANLLSRDLSNPEDLGLPPAPGPRDPRRRRRWLAAGLGVAIGVPLHLVLRSNEPDPVKLAQPEVPQPRPAVQLLEVFSLAERGLPYHALAWRLEQLELEASERNLAQASLAFRRGRLRATLRFAESVPDSVISTPAQEARLRAGLAATFLSEFTIATETLQPLLRHRGPVADTARAWLCLADDYTFSPADYRASLELLDGVLEHDPENRLALLCRAYFAVASTKLEGLPYLERFEGQAPDHWIVPHLRGRALHHDPQRAGEAALLLERAAEFTQRDCEPTLAYWIRALLISDQLSAAREQTELALRRHPQVGGLLALKAVTAELGGAPDEAEALVRQLFEVVGPQRAQLELHWLRAEPMGPALEQILSRLRRQ